jgi:hypothetical protein
MCRPKVTNATLLAPILLTVAILAAACSSPPEQPLLRQYFRSSQLNDNASLSNIALVSLDPKTDGAVTSFEITSVSEERTEPLMVKDLSKAVADAEAADGEFSKRKKDYQDKNLDAIDRVLKAESANRKLAGRDAQIQAEWTKWRNETAESSKKLSEARNVLSDARPVAELSTARMQPQPNLTTVDAQVITKDVMINATVRAPDGSTSEKPMVVTLKRVRIGEINGIWIFAAVKFA